MLMLESLANLLRLDADTYDTTLPPAIVQRMRNAAHVVEQVEGLQAQLRAKANESTEPVALMPCTWKTDLATSRPMVVTVLMGCSCAAGCSKQPCYLTAGWEPSTASKPDLHICPADRYCFSF